MSKSRNLQAIHLSTLTKFRWLIRCAAFFSVTLFMTLVFVRPFVTFEIDTAEISKLAGHTYLVSFDFLKRFGLKLESGRSAEEQAFFTLLEDGKVVGTSQATLAQITQKGGGRYLHTGNALYFSTSDGSDPRSNEHKYTTIAKVMPSNTGLAILYLFSLLSSTLALVQWLASKKAPWHSTITKTLQRMWLWFYVFGVRELGFPLVKSAKSEQVKINILRIAFGLIVTYRSSLTAISAYWYYDPVEVFGTPLNIQFLCALFTVFLASMYTIGFCAPIAGLLLLFTYAAIDRYLGIPNLGLCVFLILQITFVLSNAGQLLSIDRLIMDRGPLHLKRLVARQYGVFGTVRSRQLSYYYLITFISYALTSMGAVFFHLQDHFWMQGHTVAAIMTNSYICYQYQFFREVEARFPQVLEAISMIAITFQTIFQLFMIPLMCASWGRVFVIAWGGIFVLLSAVSLQLSFLPFLEIVLWLLLFCPAAIFSMPATSVDRSLKTFELISQKAQSDWIPVGTLMVAFLTWAVYPFHFPVGEKNLHFKSLRAATKPLNDAFFYIGCWVPCVFNKEDLSMGDCWITINRQSNKSSKLVPISAADGSRLHYHLFDPLYFGNHLIWRRTLRLLSDQEIIERHKPEGLNYQLIEKVINFDYRINGHKDRPTVYWVSIYKSDSLGRSYEKEQSKKYEGRLIHSYGVSLPPHTAFENKLGQRGYQPNSGSLGE